MSEKKINIKFIEKNQVLFWMFLLLICGIGIVILRYSTPEGIGLVNDSVGYIGGARNILAGNGYSRLSGDALPRPITNYPPLFSIVLAGIGLFGVDGIIAGWWLNIILFGVNILLIGILVKKMTASNLFAWFASVVFCISTPMLVSHAYAMSEPLYLFISLSVIFFLIKYYEEKKIGWLIAAGIASGLSILARYVGLALVATVVFSLAMAFPQAKVGHLRIKQRMIHILVYLAGAVPFVVIWLIRNMMVTENAANRQVLFHPLSQEKINEGLLNFWGWLLPETGGIIEKILVFWEYVFIGIVAAGFILVGRMAWGFFRKGIGEPKAEVPNKVLMWIFATHGLAYIAVLLFSLTFVDASPVFEHRILAPLYISIIPLICWFLSWIWNKQKMIWKGAALFVALLFLAFLAEDSLDLVKTYRKDGLGFAHSSWVESQTILAAAELPETILYSNRVTALYILNNQPAYILPSPDNPATGGLREGYQEDIANIREIIMDGEGLMIIFGYDLIIQDEEGQKWMADLTDGVPVYENTEDGIIYGLNP
ncbi:MAG: phospholipid carrier-dependent glycosyltransferase [Anaerolineaceae bacterium]|nr:phospholipid carrier-dependent glycosyltransferase [Anaerolineaceae bacterium]